MKKIKLKKILLATLISLEIILLNVPTALAISIPSADDVAGDLEKRYHLNLGSMQSMGEGFNVSEAKKTAPQVMIFFNPTDPKVGEKITAEAVPMYFQNPKEKLYFTWFLKHKTGASASRDIEGRKTEDGNTDWDRNGSIEMNDYKIEAMRLIAQGGVSSADFSKSTTPFDDDGYKAYLGGDDMIKPPFDRNFNVDAADKPNKYCYIHDFSSGADRELVNVPQPTFYCGGVETDRDSIKCTGNKNFVCTDAISFKLCQSTASTPKCNANGKVTCVKGAPRCVGDETLPPVDANGDEYNCDNYPPGAPDDILCSSFGFARPTCTPATGESVNGCRHLFPCAEDTNHAGDCNGSVGDNNFGPNEEAFWGTDPRDSDTAKNGNKDEATLAGLGVNSFTWPYQGRRRSRSCCRRHLNNTH